MLVLGAYRNSRAAKNSAERRAGTPIIWKEWGEDGLRGFLEQDNYMMSHYSVDKLLVMGEP